MTAAKAIPLETVDELHILNDEMSVLWCALTSEYARENVDQIGAHLCRLNVRLDAALKAIDAANEWAPAP